MCALFLFVVHGNKLPTAILSYTFVFIGAALFALDYLRERSTFSERELFIPYDSIGALLLLPLFYSYFFLLLNPDCINRKKVMLAYLPTLFLSLLYFTITALNEKLPPIADYNQLQPYLFAPEMIIRYLLRLGVLVQTLVLGVIIFRMYRQHRNNLAYNFSYTAGTGLKAVPWIVSVVMLYGISLFVVSFKSALWISYIPIMILAILPVIMSLMAVRQKTIYEKQEEKEEKALPQKQEYSLKDEQLKQLKRRLIELLEKDEIYKDDELSLDKVCRFLGTNRNYLYKVINLGLNTTFYDLINNYRLKHAVALLNGKEFACLKIADISEMSGYKNVSTFITGFKKIYGVTPNEYRNAEI
jgi:AraC-like DNA-binding protein